jgi:hypothetical protein
MSEDTKGTGVADAGAAAGSATAGGASGSSGQVGVGSASQESASKVFEGSIKQATDVNAEEAVAVVNTLIAALTALNGKRTYDQAQTTDLQVQSGSADTRDLVRNLGVQALQNAIETANLAGKQAVRHSDIAIDRQWNVDEQGYTVAEILNDKVFTDAVAAAVAKAVQP